MGYLDLNTDLDLNTGALVIQGFWFPRFQGLPVLQYISKDQFQSVAPTAPVMRTLVYWKFELRFLQFQIPLGPKSLWKKEYV